jgi:cell division protein FtsI (penicillin-binding protein 3)
MEIRKSILSRFALIYFIMFLFGIGVLIKVISIQNIKTDKWKQISDNLNNNTVITEANRGNICTDDGSVLATSVPGYFVRIDLAADGLKDVYSKECDSLAYCLSQMFKDIPKEQFKFKLEEGFRNKNRGLLLTPRKIDYEELQVIKQFPILRRGQNGGGRIIETENKRLLPMGSLASRMIGTMNKGAYGGVHGNIGYTGIEGAFEPYLKGEQGISYKQNLSGRWVTRTEIEPRDGMDVITSLNTKFQDIAENALLRELDTSQADWGTAILMEVKTGKIKAIANFGVIDTDPATNKNIYGENYNYAMGPLGSFEPGSTFKLMSLVVALEDGVVDTSDVFDTGNGAWKYKGGTVYDSDYKHGGHGRLTVKRIFEESSNVGVAKIITSRYENRPKDYVDRLYSFGLNKPLGLDIKGEAVPKFKYPGDNDWWGTSLAWMSFGYETKLAPIQILTFYNAFANNGKMVKPSLIEEIRDNGIVVKKFKEEVINPMIVSKETLGKAQKMLEGVCENGTGKALNDSILKIAGKTGTAQIVKNGKYGEGLYLSSFAGYFPAQNPMYSMIVTINSPKGAYYGGAVAGPVFKEIAGKVFAQKIGIPEPKKPEKKDQAPDTLEIKNGFERNIARVLNDLKIDNIPGKSDQELVEIKNNHGIVSLVGREVKPDEVPDVTGMGASSAVYLLEKKGLKVKIEGIGKVVTQSLPAGTKYINGDLIFLTLG